MCGTHNFLSFLMGNYNSKDGFEIALERPTGKMAKAGSTGVFFGLKIDGHYWRDLAYFLDKIDIPFRSINQFTRQRSQKGKGTKVITN